MEFFLDTADVEVIREFKETGLINGITTNPSLAVSYTHLRAHET